MEIISYSYHFKFKNGRNEDFKIDLSGDTLTPMQGLPEELPDWTRLDNHQCKNCPLERLTHPYCPLAARISPLVERMSDVVSIDDVDVTVISNERIISRHGAAQEALSSLIGIINATSGCPHTLFFKPMARFHVPFATLEETFYRAAASYLIGQYFRSKANKTVDMTMDGLFHLYNQVTAVNQGISNRLRMDKREDGTINALIILDMYVICLPDSLEDILTELAPLFEPFLDDHLHKT